MNDRSITVMWTVPDPNYNYAVILTNINTNMTTKYTVARNVVPSYNLQGLDPTVNFNVSVASVNMCGENRSDPITVFSKSVHAHITVYVHVCMCM